jgi:hypothetical protein
MDFKRIFRVAVWALVLGSLVGSFGLPRLAAGPDWAINPAALGRADLEGRLALALPMGPAAGSAPEFGLQLQLVLWCPSSHRSHTTSGIPHPDSLKLEP